MANQLLNQLIMIFKANDKDYSYLDAMTDSIYFFILFISLKSGVAKYFILVQEIIFYIEKGT